MKKIKANDPEPKSPDVVAENIAQLKVLFPELITEGKQGVLVNVDVLKGLVGDKTVSDIEEKYGLNWHGKRQARQLALTPSTGTLRPCPEESVDWDKTRNIMIEGDNLEVLKLLQKSYSGKVKAIYIDPPYNTGNDFVYPDNFQDSLRNYETLMGWREEGGERVSSLASRQNPLSSGRFHTDWLNMMYPRLKVAHSLLQRDGFCFISIDENESLNLRHLLDDVFGCENLAGVIVWKKGTGGSDSDFSYSHDQIVIYRRSGEAVLGRTIQGAQQLASYQNPDNDARGDWTSSDYTSKWTKTERPNLWYSICNPNTGKNCWPAEGRTWAYGKEETDINIRENLLWWGKKGENERPRFKRFKTVTEGMMVPRSWWDSIGTNEDGFAEFRALGFTRADFPHPKPVSLIRELIRLGAPSGGLVLDFFAGSGTTGHAVMTQNAIDHHERRHILVQLPEPTEHGSLANIAEVTKERLRRAGKVIREANPMFAGDLGFRVFKLASSNIQAWEPDREKLPETLESSVEHLKTDRSENDILFELLLKLGLDLTVPIEDKNVAGKTVHSVGAGTLLVCLAQKIARKEAEPLALGIVEWHKALAPAGESTVVFRDSAFADDVAKTNLAAILEQHGLGNVRSL
jgi:adenine-specific DNA-methyltransferase